MQMAAGSARTRPERSSRDGFMMGSFLSSEHDRWHGGGTPRFGPSAASARSIAANRTGPRGLIVTFGGKGGMIPQFKPRLRRQYVRRSYAPVSHLSVGLGVGSGFSPSYS